MNSKRASKDRHLDLGCGKFPRNPYRRSELHGIDIRALSPQDEGFEYRRANLALEPIPYPDGHFMSVSAYDFIEQRVWLAYIQALDIIRQTSYERINRFKSMIFIFK